VQGGAVSLYRGAAPLSFQTGAGTPRHTIHKEDIEMSRTINKVTLLGRVGTDPEMQYTPNGTAVTKLRLATDRNRSNGDITARSASSPAARRLATDRNRSNGDTETDWHSVVCWDKLAEAVNSYVGKGQRIYVDGRLVQNTWNGDDGQRRYRTEVHASEVVFLDGGNGNGHGGQTPDASPFE